MTPLPDEARVYIGRAPQKGSRASTPSSRG